MIEIKNTESKVTAAKRNVKLKDILVSKICFVDAEGENLTQKFIDALPEGTTTIELKASFELPEETEDSEEEE